MIISILLTLSLELLTFLEYQNQIFFTQHSITLNYISKEHLKRKAQLLEYSLLNLTSLNWFSYQNITLVLVISFNRDKHQVNHLFGLLLKIFSIAHYHN